MTPENAQHDQDPARPTLCLCGRPLGDCDEAWAYERRAEVALYGACPACGSHRTVETATTGDEVHMALVCASDPTHGDGISNPPAT